MGCSKEGNENFIFTTLSLLCAAAARSLAVAKSIRPTKAFFVVASRRLLDGTAALSLGGCVFSSFLHDHACALGCQVENACILDTLLHT